VEEVTASLGGLGGFWMALGEGAGFKQIINRVILRFSMGNGEWKGKVEFSSTLTVFARTVCEDCTPFLSALTMEYPKLPKLFQLMNPIRGIVTLQQP